MNLRPLLLSIAGVSLLLAAGCRTVSGGSCHKVQPHESAQSLPPLRMPPGLDGPDTSGALEIPQLNEPMAPRDPDGPCLDAPPAITAAPLPPSEVVLPDARPGRVPQEGAEPGSGGDEPRERRRPPRRPR
jgi:hypothetical protein